MTTSHKTVFVIDHSLATARSSDFVIDCDSLSKSRGGHSLIPLNPISKSLWTCAVESAVEYCRIVWDIYPTGKLIRFIASDSKPKFVGSWNPNHQNVSHLMTSFAQVGVPSESDHSDLMTGLAAGIGVLGECTDLQREKLEFNPDVRQVPNHGRIICIGVFRDDNYVRTLESCFHEALIQHNTVAAVTDRILPIHHCELVLINMYPNEQLPKIKDHPRLELSAILAIELLSLRAGTLLWSRLCSSLLLQHYSLASTTVTGIPMKEEQNAASSANYDVEIFHPLAAHADILKARADSGLWSHKDGNDYATVTLKWCTPRVNHVELWPACTAAYRISPTDVNSRPSSCLTNFLLGGRSVMLEMPRAKGSKTLSHMLSCHGGEIFLHSLSTARSVLEDPPAISEGCGGRVTDYRILDFGELMKENKLAPLGDSVPRALDRAKVRLERFTKFWPITNSATTIFNCRQIMQYVEPLPKLVLQDVLSDEEVVECKKVIYNLMAMEARNDALPPSVSARCKGMKREEQYRVLFQELESFLRLHSRTENHSRIFGCLLDCRAKPDDKHKEEELAKDKVVRATTDSPLSPPLPSKSPRLEPVKHISGPKVSLLSMWNSSVATENARKHREFVGRTKAGAGIARLYTSLEKDKMDIS